MIQIRKAHNVEQICSVLMRCRNAFFDQSINYDEQLINLSKKFAQNAIVSVVYINDEIAGFTATYCNDKVEKVAFLSMIIVCDQFQQNGLGGLLLQHLLGDCKNNGMEQLRLEVDQNNKNAIAFYKKNGFKIEKSVSEHSMFMIKKLY
ncbi:MAG: GNAT family N-acetyltransferase [Lachnospiraceae bacterium]|nr:GNAT family N-acetyltransferase [Lachnospiraceae bacterium]